MVVSLSGAQPGGAVDIQAKTANYTVTDQDYGKIFTNRAATGSITFILPAPGDAQGEVVYFRVVADQELVISSNAAGELVAYNDATASSVTIGHIAGKRIGAAAEARSDRTSWIVAATVDPTSTTVPTVA